MTALSHHADVPVAQGLAMDFAVVERHATLLRDCCDEMTGPQRVEMYHVVIKGIRHLSRQVVPLVENLCRCDQEDLRALRTANPFG